METFDNELHYNSGTPVSQDEINLVDDPALDENEVIFTHMLPGEFDIQRGQQLNQEEMRLYNASLILEYGEEKDPNQRIRLIVGTGEINRPPGRGPGEFEKVKIRGGEIGGPVKKDWKALLDFSRKFNWRHILADDFQGDFRHPDSMPFLLDGKDWKTVTHYLLGMLYIQTPAYSDLYSKSKEFVDAGVGFWGDPKAAIAEHLKNVKLGTYPLDPLFHEKIGIYVKKAYLAKFTQNLVAKQALLLTEGSVLSKRSSFGKILDVKAYNEVRELIKQNLKLVYEGDNKYRYLEEDIPLISNSEELNPNKVFQPVSLEEFITNARDLLTDLEIQKIDIEEQDCIVYLATGTYNLNLPYMTKLFGEPKLVKRNVYGIERITDNKAQNLMIGIQRQATSIEIEYILFSGQLEDMSLNLYLQPFLENGNYEYAIFILTNRIEQRILDLLRLIVGVKL